jgi:hypothetical protein
MAVLDCNFGGEACTKIISCSKDVERMLLNVSVLLYISFGHRPSPYLVLPTLTIISQEKCYCRHNSFHCIQELPLFIRRSSHSVSNRSSGLSPMGGTS